MSQYHNGEACTNCNCPTHGKTCKECGYPMCDLCYHQNKGECSYCKHEAKTTVVASMDNDYANYEYR